MRRVDGDRLIALRLEGVHDEGPLEGHAAAFAHLANRFNLAVGKCARIVQQAADQSGFSVINMADDSDIEAACTRRFFAIGENIEFARWFVHGALHVTVSAQALEGIFRFMVHRPPGTLGRRGDPELGDDFIDGRRLAIDRRGDVFVAERAVAFAVAREIERHGRDVFPLGIEPHIYF